MQDQSGIIALLAANVRQVRKDNGMSQEALAFEAGLDRTYVSQVERRKRNPTVVVLARLAGALGVAPGDLLTPHRSNKGKIKR